MNPAIKYGVIIAIIIGYSAFFYQRGVSHERTAWELSTAKRAIEVQKQLAEKTKIAMEKTNQSAELAQQLEDVNHDKQTEINALHDQLVKSSKLHRKPLCRRSGPSPASKNNNSGVVIESAADTTEISDEFAQFLVSEARRADEVSLYAELANDFINELCTDPGFKCGK